MDRGNRPAERTETAGGTANPKWHLPQVQGKGLYSFLIPGFVTSK